MADLTTTVDLIFQGVDNASDVIVGLSKDIKSLSGSVQDTLQPVANLTKSVLAFEAAILTTGAAVLGFAVNTARDFELSFREIASLIDEPIDALQDFRQEILDYASSSTQGLDQITQSVYAAISAGVDYTDSLSFVRQAEQLAIAGKADLSATTVALASALNAYGLEADNAARFSDILFTTVRLGQTTIPELASSLATVTGTAADAQVPFEEIAAAIATLTASGVPTAEAITQIRGAIAAFIKPSSEAATLAEQLGINFDLSTIRSEGLAGALQMVAEASGGNAEVLARLFGRVEALSAVLTLTGVASDKFSDSLVQIQNGAGATEEAVAKFEGVVGRAGNSLTVFLTELGTPFLGVFADAKAAIGSVIDAITASLGTEGSGLNLFRDLLVQYANDLLTTIQGVAEALPEALAQADYSDFTAGLEAIVEGVKNLFGGLDITTVDGLVTAIEFVGSGFLALSEISANALGVLEPILVTFFEIAESALSLDSGLFALLGTFGGVSIALTTLLPALDTLLLAVIALNSGKAFGGMVSVIGTLIPLLGKAGIAGLITLAAYETGQWIGEVTGIRDALYGQSDALGEVNEAIDRYSKTTGASLEVVDQQLVDFQALRKEYDALLGKYADVSTESVALAQSFEETGKATDLTRQEFEALIEQLEIQEQIQAVVNDTVRDFPVALQPASDAVRQYVRELDEQGNLTIRAAEEGEKLGDVLYTNTQTLRDGTQVVNEFYGALNSGAPAKAAEDSRSLSEQLDAAAASGELAKDKYFELRTELEKEELKAKVEFDIAQLEQDTIRIQSQIQGVVDLAQIKATVDIAEIEAAVEKSRQLFESLNVTTEVVGDNINNLVNAIAGIDSADRFAQDKLDIFRDALDRELVILELNAETQRELADAQIAELNARAQRLRSGEALIQIDGAGLQPELEAFMFRIIETVQLRANADGQAFLLGV